MLIIGHRGAAGLERENTVGSFKKAEQLGVDMIEMDLRRNRQGQIIVSHNRTSNNKVLTLAQALREINSPVNLELKQAGFEAEVLHAVKSFSSKVLISSKHMKVLKKIRALDGKVRLGLVLGRANFSLLPFLSRLDRQLNLYSIHPKTFLASKRLIDRWRRRGKKVFVWTVNQPKQYEKFKALGVDGVFTDYPNLIKN